MLEEETRQASLRTESEGQIARLVNNIDETTPEIRQKLYELWNEQIHSEENTSRRIWNKKQNWFKNLPKKTKNQNPSVKVVDHQKQHQRTTTKRWNTDSKTNNTHRPYNQQNKRNENQGRNNNTNRQDGNPTPLLPAPQPTYQRNNQNATNSFPFLDQHPQDRPMNPMAQPFHPNNNTAHFPPLPPPAHPWLFHPNMFMKSYQNPFFPM